MTQTRRCIKCPAYYIANAASQSQVCGWCQAKARSKPAPLTQAEVEAKLRAMGLLVEDGK